MNMGAGVMRIINTFDKIPNCYKDHVFDLDLWRNYTKDFSSELAEKCESDAKEYDFDRDIFPVVNNVKLNDDAARLANASFLTVTEQLDRNMYKLFENDVDLDIVLYLGLCNGAGWATTLDDRDAVLLGIEKIIELNWQYEATMRALIYHEIGHIWHKTHGILCPEIRSSAEDSLVQLYQEGVAMVCEQILCEDDAYYHQDKNGWLAWCKEHKTEIKREYLRRMENNESTQDFFGDWCDYHGHSDVGYYLGCEFVKYLQMHYSLTEIANLPVDTLCAQYKRFVML